MRMGVTASIWNPLTFFLSRGLSRRMHSFCAEMNVEVLVERFGERTSRLINASSG